MIIDRIILSFISFFLLYNIQFIRKIIPRNPRNSLLKSRRKTQYSVYIISKLLANVHNNNNANIEFCHFQQEENIIRHCVPTFTEFTAILFYGTYTSQVSKILFQTHLFFYCFFQFSAFHLIKIKSHVILQI